MKHKLFIILNLLFLGLSLTGCKKLVDVGGPKTSLSSASMYEKDITAASVLTGIYSIMSATGIQATNLSGICYFTGLSSDELALINNSNQQFLFYYSNMLNSQDANTFWNNIYPEIYVVNAAIDGITRSETLTPIIKQQLLGEAKFIRAFCFFYLVNLYGDVPLILGTDYKVNTLMSRTSKTKVWEQIIIDLKEAATLLSPDYLDAALKSVSGERVRPTKWAATALLARTYLYTKDWKQAEEQANVLLENPNYGLAPLREVFLKNNKEAIWQLQPVRIGDNSQEAIGFVIDPRVAIDRTPATISPSLLKRFDRGDQRRNNWINTTAMGGITYTYAYKYKKVNFSGDINFPVDEYSTVLRLAEQYLIRSEARIQQGNIVEGIADLNVLRRRATDITVAPNTQLQPINSNLSKEEALLAVEHERQIELFTEWGHRWLDLKRTNRVDVVMKTEVPQKIPNAIWKSYQQWYPIYFGEIQKGPNLVQSEGY